MKIKTPNIVARLGLAFAAFRGKSYDPMDRFFDGQTDLKTADAVRPYRQVSTVYTCVRKRFMALSRLPLMVSTADDQVLESGPLVEITENPNPKMTRREFWKAVCAYLDLTGACYLWFSDLGEGDRRNPVHVYPFSAAKFRKRKENGVHVGWWYRTDGGYEKKVPLDEVHEIIEPDYEIDLDTPMSPRHAVHMAVQQFYKSDRANLSSLDNDVQPGGAISTDQPLTDQQRREIKTSIHEAHAGVLNRRRLMVLEGGLHFERIQAAFKEMEFTELKKMSRTDICAGYLVPPAVAGYYEDSNYAHTDAAHIIFWSDTILPLAEWLGEEWTVAVLCRFGSDRLRRSKPRVTTMSVSQRSLRSRRLARAAASRSGVTHYAWFDASDVPAVQKARLSVVEQAETWNKLGIPLNQILRSTDAPFEEVPWGDTWFKPMSLVDVQEDTAGLEPAPGPEPEDTPQDTPGDDPGDDPGDESGKTVAKALTEKQRADMHAAWWRSIMPLIGDGRRKISGHFRDLRAEVNKNINRAEAAKAIVQKDLVGELLFDLVRGKKRLRVKARPLVRASTLLGGAQSMEDAAVAEGKAPEAADVFNIADPRVKAKMLSRENRITGVDDTLHRRLKKKLADAVAEGKSLTDIREVVRVEFNIASNRAATIARTEVGAAVEEARHEGRKQAGIPLKSWLWSRRETGRAWHMEAEQQTHANPIAREALFTLPQTGNTCQHPRATNDPQDDINCGCTALSRFPDDQKDARLMAHRAEHGFLDLDTLNRRMAPRVAPRIAG